MSEEILKALMQLFAIISKQDEGTTENQRSFVVSFLSSQLNKDKVKEYLSLYDEKAGGTEAKPGEDGKIRSGKLTAMKDSVRTLAICRKINKTLSQKQKVVVLIRIFELLKLDELYTEQRMGIIETVATVFNIEANELELINNFSRYDDLQNMNTEENLVIQGHEQIEVLDEERFKTIYSDGLDGRIYILRIKSADLYFVKYKGKSEISLNGLVFNVSNTYIFPQGSTLRLPKGTIYYSDVISCFLKDEDLQRISFNCDSINYQFPNGNVALRDVNINEEFGLVGIMGASGSGKTTLMNVLSGIDKPFSGSVKINGIDIHNKPKVSKGIIGYIAQDDFLFEELTVYENLYYSAKLCFKDLSEKEIEERVNNTLQNLGLEAIADIKVGSPLNKKISGGQRKRLNIALELIREPLVLFVDEPTSGLSSKDSENVMDLLKELSLHMKLIFVVIHQPSSDIFKMFDRLFILDTGGYPVYYGNPIESIIYFKTITNQINADIGECSSCGNVNPEMLFNIIESKEVDDFGKFTLNRIKSPKDWNEMFLVSNKDRNVQEVKEIPKKILNIPNKLMQLIIFTKRDLLSKISNLQYLLINLLEAPLLALILTGIIKFSSGRNGEYIFKDNENIPPYIFMSIVIALFIGLSVSAEEIFRDRKILKRESFLNLSRSSYLMSKVVILFTLSAIQTFTFVLIGNQILEIKGLFFEYWIVLFITACFANIMGLNISSAFNSAVTIYIMIPLLVIPQMILGGAMFSFDKLNSLIGGGENTSPVIADVMVSRWAYEALAVTQFKENEYQKNFYDLEKLESMASYKQAYFIPELERIVRETEEFLRSETSENYKLYKDNLTILRNEIAIESQRFTDIPTLDLSEFEPNAFSLELVDQTRDFLENVNLKYATAFNRISEKKNNLIENLSENPVNGVGYNDLYMDNYNESLSNLLKKSTLSTKIKRKDGRLIQILDPVYLDPETPEFLSMRAPFYSPTKYLFGNKTNTITFNIWFIIAFTLILYITLYYDLLSKSFSLFNRKKF